MPDQRPPVQVPAQVGVGDPMPRVTLPQAAGGLFDSWDPRSAGHARIYWLGAPPDGLLAPDHAQRLAASETLLHVVTTTAPAAAGATSWLIDAKGELAKVFAGREPLAIAVDSGGRVAAVMPMPAPADVAALAERMFAASSPAIVEAKAPVLLIDRVADEALCRALIDYWSGHAKIANSIDAAGGNVVAADLKRRQDVQVDDPVLFARLQNALMRRVAPLIAQAFHTPIAVMEAPLIGCYDTASGGWFRRHRDNTTPMTANRQYAVSLNLNGGDEYDGGEVRFAEFGRELYRPAKGGALVFSCSLLHEVVPVTRGRRIGLFTFLSARGRDPRYAQQARPGR
ncbi:MAG: 2OG-Fe(II) oxygenase [Alphaproteobacteria bacterium]|nr:2OG-Fe(II) oxygenase [Alphaproteobacteria bacterium]